MGELSKTTINGVSYDLKDAGAARQSHSHTKSQITDFPTSMPASDVSSWAKQSSKPSYTASEVGAIATSEKGAASGVASLDSSGKIPSSQLPSYVDDVLEYSAKSSFPSTGETGKIYVDTSTNKTYRWSGSAYVEISASLALGETSSTAYAGDKGKTAYSHATDSSRLTTAQSSGLYKIATTAQGHIASVTAVAKSDITNLGIPGSDTNTHRPIQVNGTQVLGDNTTALNLKAGSNVSLSNSSGTVTIAATDTTYSVVSTSGNGLAPKVTDTSKFLKGDGTWATPANTWTAMVGATSSTNGSVGYVNATPPKDGYNTKYLRADGSWQVPPNTTYSAATQSANGLMSSTDKTKLDGIATGATANIGTVTQVKVGSTAYNPSSGVISLPAYPSDTNTHRPIQVNGTEILGNNTTALNLKAGSNVSLSNSSGTVTIAATDTNTWVSGAAFADNTSTDANNPLKLTLSRSGSLTTDVTGTLPKVSSSSAGVVSKVPAVSSQSQSTKFLREDGTWAKPSYTTNTNTTYTFGSGSTNGAFSVTPSGGSAQMVSIYGLKSAAYTDSSAYATSGHTHGNIQNGGTLQSSDITIGNGDKLIVTDYSDGTKIARASLSFDGSTTSQALTKAGTWQTFNNYTHPSDGSNTGSFGPSSSVSPSSGGSFSVPYITVNSKGHVTAASTKTITLPIASRIAYVTHNVFLSGLTWTQSGSGMWYSSNFTVPYSPTTIKPTILLGVSIYDFNYIPACNIIPCVVSGSGDKIWFMSSVGSFASNAELFILIHGIY